MDTNEKIMTFAAIDPVIEVLVEGPKETRTGTWVRWGDRNTYPQFLEKLVRNAATLHSVVLGLVDYVCGNDVRWLVPGMLQGGFMDTKRTTLKKFVKWTGESVAKTGGFAWLVRRSKDGAKPASLEVLPMRYLRTDEDNATFWYNEKWGERSASTQYPAWVPGTKEPVSVFYCKIWGEGVYPEPIYEACVKECATEMGIADFHMGNIERGFMGSYIVNFNNGSNVTDKVKEEIERNFTRKFAGHRNAGRVMFSYNPNVQNRTTVEKLEVSDYGEKYSTLTKHCRQQIFTAFRANPNLFGIATESSGFNTEEYEAAFKLFNRTMVQPIQAEILDALAAVMEMPAGVAEIEPFTLEGASEQDVK